MSSRWTGICSGLHILTVVNIVLGYDSLKVSDVYWLMSFDLCMIWQSILKFQYSFDNIKKCFRSTLWSWSLSYNMHMTRVKTKLNRFVGQGHLLHLSYDIVSIIRFTPTPILLLDFRHIKGKKRLRIIARKPYYKIIKCRQF